MKSLRPIGSLLLRCLLIAASHPAFCATLEVPGDFLAIQDAIDSATHGDEIVVATGTYFGSIDLLALDIVLRSTDPTDPEVVAATILDASGATEAVRFDGAQTAACQFLGFYVTGVNETRSTDHAQAIRGRGTFATLRYNVIRGNYGDAAIGFCHGEIADNTVEHNDAVGLEECDGHIHHNSILDNWKPGLRNCDALIEENKIGGNWAHQTSGGGISGGGGTLRRNIIAGNRGVFFSPNPPHESYGGKGGGVAGFFGIIENNLIVSNVAYDEGGGLLSCSGWIVHNTIANNWTELWASEGAVGGGISRCGGTIANNIIEGDFYSSSVPSYCLLTDPDVATTGVGNIAADPQFGQGYDLQPDSPGIDAGGAEFAADTDYDGVARPIDSVTLERGDGSNYDIGAYEFIGTATPSVPPRQPTHVAPISGATNVGLRPTLSTSRFDDPGDSGTTRDPFQSAVHWQIATDVSFSSPTLDRTYHGTNVFRRSGENYSSLKLSEDDSLSPETLFWWRVAYRDDHLEWSEWSVPTSFTTRPGGPILVPSYYPTITEALQDAVEGDEVVLLPGVYEEVVEMQGHRALTIRSIDPTSPEVVANTVVSGQLLLEGSERLDYLFTGFTVTGPGTGIVGQDNSKPTLYGMRLVGNTGNGLTALGYLPGSHVTSQTSVQDCEIGNNTGHGIDASTVGVLNSRVYGNGGNGVYQCNGLIEGNRIYQNAGRGIKLCGANIVGNRIYENRDGGIEDCDELIERNYIFSNHALYGGGARSCNGFIQCNLIYGNSAEGGAFSNCDGPITNNIFFLNVATEYTGGLLNCDGSIYCNTFHGNYAPSDRSVMRNCNGSIANNIIWDTTASREEVFIESSLPQYCIVQGWLPDEDGNFGMDPMFRDAAAGDFRLLPNSPCIDAGKFVEGLTTDFEGDPRPMDGVAEPRGDGSDIDIGADEFYSFFDLDSDLDSDAQVDSMDLMEFIRAWKPEKNLEGDLNEDGAVDELDLHVLLKDWRRGTGPR